MTERLRDRQFAFRRSAIIHVAGEVLADTGCRSFTMAEVASRLATSKATLYRHFDSRDALIRLAIRQAGRQTVEDARAAASASDGRARLAEVARLVATRCLGVGRDGALPPCCLVEVVCPFLDREELGSLFAEGGSAWPGPSGVGLVDSIVALSAVVAARRTAESVKPSSADVDAIVRILLPDEQA